MKRIFSIFLSIMLIPVFSFSQTSTDCSAVTISSATNNGTNTFDIYLESDGIRNGNNYFGSTVYYPQNTTSILASIIIVPGYLNFESSMQNWGPFLASHGIVCMTIGTNSIYDLVNDRKEALQDALISLKAENTRINSPLFNKLDTNLVALGGWSMGGGGAQLAAVEDSTIKAIIALCPWIDPLQITVNSLNHDIPTLFFSGQNDVVAPPSTHANVHYNFTPSTTDKLIYEISSGGHWVANGPSGGQGEVGRMALSWLQKYLIEDSCFCPLLLDTPLTASGYHTNLTCFGYGCTDSLALNYDLTTIFDDGSCIYPLAIGNTHQGGIVFWLDGNGGGLISSTADQSSAAQWGCYGTPILGADGMMIGTGAQNTIDIEAGCTTSATAADICANYTDGTYSDWFLPSKDELGTMYLNIGQGNALGLGNIGSFSTNYYWSSTEYVYNFFAWFQDFGNGYQNSYDKYYNYNVRAIRAISSSNPGCTDSTACNYDPLATTDDGSCTGMFGCMDSLYVEYSAAATCDDGSCLTLINNSCTNPSPTGAYVNELIHDRARINWGNMNDANCMVTQYRIKYRELGSSTWSQKNMANTGLCLFGLNTTSKKIVGLMPSTTYEYYMKAWYCGGSTSAWSAIQNFTTSVECENVINFAVSTPTNTKATFTWDSTSAYSFARIKLREDTTGGVWTSAGGFGVMYPVLTKDKNGLTLGTSYRAQARTWCDPTGGAFRSAAWSPLVFWTQPNTIRLEGGSAINNLTIYPNPSRDVFNLSFTSDTKQNLKVRILNVIGEELINDNLEQFIGEYTKQINLSDNAKGIYFLEIETNDGIINKKLIFH